MTTLDMARLYYKNTLAGYERKVMKVNGQIITQWSTNNEHWSITPIIYDTVYHGINLTGTWWFEGSIMKDWNGIPCILHKGKTEWYVDVIVSKDDNGNMDTEEHLLKDVWHFLLQPNDKEVE